MIRLPEPLNDGTSYACGWNACLRAIKELEPKDLNILVAEKILDEHRMSASHKQGDDLALVACSCNSHWSVPMYGSGEDCEKRVKESMKSHHISVGLKPSEIL